MAEIIDIGKDFYHRLANRNKKQGDGKHTAVEFFNKYVEKFCNHDLWMADLSDDPFITFDFLNVKRISPGFANEAFCPLLEFATTEKIMEKIKIVNATDIQVYIIKFELEESEV